MWAMCSSMYCGWVVLVAGVLGHKWSCFMVLMHAPLIVSWAFGMTIALLSSSSTGDLLWVHRLQFWQRVCSWCPLCRLRAADILLSSETICMHLVDCICRSIESRLGHWHSLQVAVYVWHCGSSCAHCFRTTDSRICLQCSHLSNLVFYAMAGFLVFWAILCRYAVKILSEFAAIFCLFVPLIGSMYFGYVCSRVGDLWHLEYSLLYRG